MILVTYERKVKTQKVVVTITATCTILTLWWVGGKRVYSEADWLHSGHLSC